MRAAIAFLGLLTMAGPAMAGDCGSGELEPLATYDAVALLQSIIDEKARVATILGDFDRGHRPMEENRSAKVMRYLRNLETERRRVETEIEMRRDNPGPHDPLRPVITVAGGSRTASYPSVGALLYNHAVECSGTLIGSNFFLTSKHCFHRSNNPSSYDVYFQHGGLVGVEAIKRHQDDDVDLAWLILDHPINGAGLTRLPNRSTTIGEQRLVAGFGRTSATSVSSSGIKRQGSVTTVECPDAPGDFVCWEADPTGSVGICPGDSGGWVGTSKGAAMDPVQDAVSERVRPPSTRNDRIPNCRNSIHWSRSLKPHLSTISDEKAASEVPQRNPLPSCCGEGIDVLAAEGSLPNPNSGAASRTYDFGVKSDVRLVRIAMNAQDKGPPPRLEIDFSNGVANPGKKCANRGRFQTCEYSFEQPPPSDWTVAVRRDFGRSMCYQLVVTMY